MNFAPSIKRNRAVREVGQITMCVGVIAYNQLMLVFQRKSIIMQTHEYFIPGKMPLPVAGESVDNYMNAPLASTLDVALPPGMRQVMPFGRVKLQPSEVCPRNFIIFDQTNQQSRMMFHPAVTYKFNTPGFDFQATCPQDFEKGKVNQPERDLSSPFEEDSNDIAALLSLEMDDELEDSMDEEEVSTARTHDNYESTSDTCSSYCSKPSKKRLSSSLEKSAGTRGDHKKQQEMKRMVNMLRRIVPGGGNQMDAVAVLDEAVKYLKSLKVEVEQFGVGP
ncbi:transcription factor bHLH144 [Arachis hypogaea]|uniref:transcription factor bHLH144 n=2 Tax=Arachis TaxID=3817 RepID=UPI003B210692